jgi:intein-encoded DNA endonuclease-like protein
MGTPINSVNAYGKRCKFTEKEQKQIIDLYLNGKNQVEIAKLFNTYNTSIRRILLKHNIKIISSGDRQRFVKNNPFLKNNEISNYFFGMLITQ